MTADLLQVRALEQTESWTPWDRRVWQPGTLLSLQELVEAASWCERGVLSQDAVQWLRGELLPELGRDSGLATPAVRMQLEEALKRPIAHASQRRRRLEALIDFLVKCYLDGWRDAVAAGTFEVERAARYVCSHMLDLGFHPEHLRKIINECRDATAVELIEHLRDLSARPARTYRGWVLLTAVPERSLMEQHPDWMSPADVASAMRGIGMQPPREQSGALYFKVKSRDEISAATVIREQLERLVSRTKFLRAPQRLSHEPKLWRADGEPIPLAVRGSDVNATSLAKASVLYEGRLDGSASDAAA